MSCAHYDNCIVILAVQMILLGYGINEFTSKTFFFFLKSRKRRNNFLKKEKKKPEATKKQKKSLAQLQLPLRKKEK